MTKFGKRLQTNSGGSIFQQFKTVPRKENMSAEKTLSIGSVDYAIDEVTRLKSLYVKTEDIHCVEDALFHLRRAKEALVDGLANAKEWSKETEEAMKIFLFMMPYIVAMMPDKKLTHPHSAP